MTRASEGQHWYARDGEPRYEVPAKNGSMRPATLRDARIHGWYPGVTSIIKCAAAPGLENWKRDQVLMAALTLPRIEGESCEQLNERIVRDSQEQAKKAREWGTAFHAAIQGHYEGTPPAEEMWLQVHGAAEAIDANFPGHVWTPEKACAHPSGFGTKADLHSTDAVLDFKGSEFTEAEMPTLKTYDEHAMQLAATRKALHAKDGIQRDKCGIVYVSRIVPGLCRVIRVDEPNLEKGWEMFQALLAYWKASRGYYPERWQEKAAA